MRKSLSLILPLLILPCLSSCNKVDTKVTEDEFYKAIKLEGVDYAQALYEAPASANSNPYISYEFSPTRYLEKEMESPTSPIYSGTLVTKNDEGYLKYSYDPVDEKWSGPETTEESSFNKPNYLYSEYFREAFDYFEADYSQFEYNSKNQSYECSFSMTEDYTFSFKFENKVLTKYTYQITYSGDLSSYKDTSTMTTILNVAYEKKTPDMPF